MLIQLTKLCNTKSMSRGKKFNHGFYYSSLSQGELNTYHATYCCISYNQISRESWNNSYKRNSPYSISRSQRK